MDPADSPQPGPADPLVETETSVPLSETSKTIRADAETVAVAPGAAPEAAPAAESEDSLPALRGYSIEREIASGGMGTVYLATQKPPGRQVALKVVRLQPFRVETVRRFEAEVGAVAKMDHPAIITVYEVGASGSLLYFSMTLIDGGSLRDAMQDQRIGVRRALELVRQIAEALHYAHQRGIVHRDVKPENILLSKEGAPYLTDFGLARDLTSDQRVTATGTLAGTPLYMSPEQARGEKYIDHRTDVYSLGATLYELLALRPPFQAASMMGLLAGIMTQEPTRLRKIDPRIPRDVETLVEKAMRKNPNDRYTSAASFAQDLARYQEGRPIEARPVAPLVRLLMAMRRNPLVSTLAALAVVAGLVGLGLWDHARAQRLAKQEESLAAAEALFAKGFSASGDDAEQAYLKALEELNLGLALGVWSQRPLELRARIRQRFLQRAEREGDERLAQLFLADLRNAAQALEPGSTRRELLRFTEGEGRISIRLAEPLEGATLKVLEHSSGGLLMAPRRGDQFVIDPAPMGLYTLQLTAPGRAPLKLPLWLERCERRELTVRLLAPGEIPRGMVYVPAGPFYAGGTTPGARPAARRVLPGFLIDRAEVTSSDYAGWLATLPPAEAEVRRARAQGRGVQPVTGVTWEDARAYAAAQGKRLPSEDEWTKAARGDDPRPYSFGWRFDPALTNVARPEQGPVEPGTSGDLSPYGCFDMAGNVSEIVADAFWPDQNPDGPRVRRGGAWTLAPHYARITYRDPIPKHEGRSYLGFRCAKELPALPD